MGYKPFDHADYLSKKAAEVDYLMKLMQWYEQQEGMPQYMKNMQIGAYEHLKYAKIKFERMSKEFAESNKEESNGTK